jgi:ABC-type bacteriocin/lantibiotic exporter with double-glycine peptidase domain
MPVNLAPREIGFVSQHSDINDPTWRYRGCGIAALKMLMNYWQSENEACASPATEDLLQTGLALGAYLENIGWSHRGLINIAKKYGYNGYNVDEPNRNSEELYGEMSKVLEAMPLMASVYSKFDPSRGGGHIVVVSGTEGDDLIIYDPEELSSETGRTLISKDKFLNGWKKRYIVIEPNE